MGWQEKKIREKINALERFKGAVLEQA